jgi:hypothetical protein
MKERPVWKRHLLRTLRSIDPLPAPTEEEKHDAIVVLEDESNMGIPGLWDEANRIFDEASVGTQKAALRKLTG